MRRCYRCGVSVCYEDDAGEAWCEQHFACATLCSEGVALRWPTLAFPAGKGLVVPSQDTWQDAEAGTVPMGRYGYYQFCQEEPCLARIWLAAYYAHEVRLGLKSLYRVTSVAQVPCARAPGGCTRDVRTPMQLWHTKDEGGRYVYPAYRATTDLYGNVWCAGCRAGARLLEFSGDRGFPAYRHGSLTIAGGYAAWYAFATHATPFEIVWVYDTLRKGQNYA